MDVSIIIVNYNTADLIKHCLDSVLAQQNITHEILVVDNASTDQSLAALNNYSDKINLLINQKNIGFGPANNQAFKASQGRFILLLNPDANLTTSHDVKNLIDFMENHPKIGLASPKIIKNKKIAAPRYRYPGQKHGSVNLVRLPGTIAWVLGACMIIRRDAFQQIHGFDEDYFLYGEETDLCLRLRKVGWEIGYHDQTIVEHLGGGSERKNNFEAVLRKKQAGLHLFYKKHYQPNEIQKIIKHDFFHAKLQITLLRFKKLLGFFNNTDHKKFAKYALICENYLKNVRYPA